MTTTERAVGGSTGKSMGERVGTALAHRIRVQILCFLNEAVYTADELAEIIGESRQTIHHHLSVLLRDQSIEIARVERRRNANLHFYRAIAMPSFDEEELATMTSEERQAIAGLIVQHCTAEIMAALANGKLSDDPAVVLAWRWFNLDEQGRRELLAEQERLWHRAREIEADSTNRRASSGEDATSMVVAQWGFERAWEPPAPAPVSDS